MTRPRGLKLTSILMVVYVVMGFFTVNPNNPNPISMWGFLSGYSFFAAIGFYVIWAYWKGAGWARIVVMVFWGFSILNLSILNLRLWNYPISLEEHFDPVLLVTPWRVWLSYRALVGIILLIWLNTSEPKAFFARTFFLKPPPEPADPTPGDHM